MPQIILLILLREHGLYILKTDGSGKMAVAFTIKEINYLMISLFCDVALPLSYSYLFCFVLFAIFILHSRESELYRYTLDGKSALAWELPFSRFMGHLSST